MRCSDSCSARRMVGRQRSLPPTRGIPEQRDGVAGFPTSLEYSRRRPFSESNSGARLARPRADSTSPRKLERTDYYRVDGRRFRGVLNKRRGSAYRDTVLGRNGAFNCE